MDSEIKLKPYDQIENLENFRRNNKFNFITNL